MITVITGTPGAGKTLYAISKLLLQLVNSTVTKVNDDGQKVEIPRRIFTNIKGLLIEHELIEEGGRWTYQGQAWNQDANSNRQGLHNWHEWAPPGAVIVVDEFQKWWPPRPNGAAIPPDIQALDTHRHQGVDFILITQNVMNADRHTHGLCNRHLHVRRFGNLPAAIVYEWDHCSRTLMYSKALAKAPWRYDKSVFKLYHSADLHTKQPRKIPTLVYIILVAVALAAWKIPESVSRISAKSDQVKTNTATVIPGRETSSSKAAPVDQVQPIAPAAAPPAADALAAITSGQKLPQGCVRFASHCGCFVKGELQRAEPDRCEAAFAPGQVIKLADFQVTDAAAVRPPLSEADKALLRDFRGEARRSMPEPPAPLPSVDQLGAPETRLASAP